MNKSELVDAFFDGTLTDSERQDFLNQVSNDAELRQEFNFQSEIIEGIKQSRISELKAMLNNVPIAGGFSAGSMMSKVASIGGVVLISGLSYYYFTDTNSEKEVIKPKEHIETIDDLILAEEKITKEKELISNNEVGQVDNKAELKETEIVSKNKVKANNTSSAPRITKPELIEPLELIEESDEEFETPSSGISEKSTSSLSTVDVKIDNSKKKYSFHYQLNDGRLFLFGTFDKGLYEILEFNSSNGKTLFLYYKDKYYELIKTNDTVSPLNEVIESTLITKLEAVRKEIKE